MPATPGGTAPRLTHRAAVLALVLLVLVISYASSLRAWLDQRQEIAGTEAEIIRTQEQVDELEREKRRWADDAYVEQQARDRLAYVLPGEIGYRVITAEGEPLGVLPEPTVELEWERDASWYDTLWRSSERAGRD